MKVAIIYYSTYGHIVTMAKLIKEGLDNSGLVAQADIFQVPETLTQEVLEKMHAPPKADYPIATMETLVEYDAFLFGVPTRFGNLPAQWKAFWDSTGSLWQQSSLFRKPAGLFISSGGQGGGQEITARNCLSILVHHGMLYIPLGYADAFAQITSFDEIHGSSPYGSGTIAGSDGSRVPSALELEIARIQGESFAKAAYKIVPTPAQPETKPETTAEAVNPVAPVKERGASKAAEARETRASQTVKSEKEKESGGAKCFSCVIV